jgi:hypothetical protein
MNLCRRSFRSLLGTSLLLLVNCSPVTSPSNKKLSRFPEDITSPLLNLQDMFIAQHQEDPHSGEHNYMPQIVMVQGRIG